MPTCRRFLARLGGSVAAAGVMTVMPTKFHDCSSSGLARNSWWMGGSADSHGPLTSSSSPFQAPAPAATRTSTLDMTL